MSGFISSQFTSSDIVKLRLKARRDLGEEIVQRDHNLFVKASTDPKAYIKERMKHIKNAYAESKDSYVRYYKAMMKIGKDEKEAEAVATEEARKELEKRLTIVEQLYPKNYNDLVSTSLMFHQRINNASGNASVTEPDIRY